MNIHIIGGGTVSYIRNHMALCAPAYGQTARHLYRLFCTDYSDSVYLHLTKMADPEGSQMETNQDVAGLIDRLCQDPSTNVIILNAALCDYDGSVVDLDSGALTASGKHETRLKTRAGNQTLILTPASKLISNIKSIRPDIYVVGFKTTTGVTEQEQITAAGNLFPHADLVLANDTVTRSNILCSSTGGTMGSMDRYSILKKLTEAVTGNDRIMVPTCDFWKTS